MLLVVDIGNTRTKWSAVNEEDGKLIAVKACANTSLSSSKFKSAFRGVKKVLIANVAGDEVAELVKSLIPSKVEVVFVKSQAKVGRLNNRYQFIESLGVDRWLAAIAAWHLKKQPSVVVSAGTAVTIDAVGKMKGLKNKSVKEGAFIGGTIMPGLHLMHTSLGDNTANLKGKKGGKLTKFPINTQDAIATGCVNSVVGAILLMAKQLEKHSAYLPRIFVTGGDANKIAEALKFYSKRVIIAENLVLQGLAMQGLALLEKETL